MSIRIGARRDENLLWNVWFLSFVHDEALSLFNREQYLYITSRLSLLAREESPSRSDVLSIDKIEDWYELREWGGVLRGMNIRAFYGIDEERRAIVTLGLLHKKNDGPTREGDKMRIRRRWRHYREGRFGPFPQS